MQRAQPSALYNLKCDGVRGWSEAQERGDIWGIPMTDPEVCMVCKAIILQLEIILVHTFLR